VFKDSELHKFESEEILFKEAMSIIVQVWPEIGSLIERINPRISLQTTDRSQFESESDPKTFGEIIFNMKSDCPVHWAEILVHEIAHHYLTILLGTSGIDDKMKLKLKEEGFSNQRKSVRPLVGILHGVYAQCCILIFACNVLLNGEEFEQWQEGARKTYSRYAPIFPLDLATVEQEGILFHPSIVSLAERAGRLVSQVQVKDRATL
jgi:HEXXH motif-containing protein